jgi:cyclopropane fatty-acyl-phospholipid synthase-like methyltransferase
MGNTATPMRPDKTLEPSSVGPRAADDRSNDFYELFLDESMTYSAAVFEEDSSLEDAQRLKYRRMAEKAGLTRGDHILEIGCGWGGFAEYAAGELGCRVTGITLSEEQARYARRRMTNLGPDDRFVRMWDFYLATCEAAFASRKLGTLQLVLARPGVAVGS